MNLNAHELAALIEYQLLKPDASVADVDRVCTEARTHGFASVCVNGSRVIRAAARLEESEVKVATVVGFPFGAADADAKRFEAEVAIDNGAQEINMVINIGWLKDGAEAAVLREMRDVVEAAEERPVGVVLETHLLTREERVRACGLIAESGVKSVITGTGFGPAVITVEDVKLLRDNLSEKISITAGGGITAVQTALAMIEAGASKLGTSEALAIMRNLPTQ